jgi:hypothetical protein
VSSLSSRRTTGSDRTSEVADELGKRCNSGNEVDLLRQLSNPPPLFHKAVGRTVGTPIDDASRRRRSDVDAQVARQEQRRLSPNQIAALVVEYRTGSTVPELIRSYGICRTTVLAHLHRSGVETRPSVFKLKDDDRAAIFELYESGLSLVRIGAACSVDSKAIGRVLERAAVPRGPRRGGSVAGSYPAFVVDTRRPGAVILMPLGRIVRGNVRNCRADPTCSRVRLVP